VVGACPTRCQAHAAFRAVELDASAERRHRAEAHASAREDPNPGSAGTITLSTYVFALIAVGSCIVGSVFSFVASKIIDTIKGQ
jgi:hypothetical protein